MSQPIGGWQCCLCGVPLAAPTDVTFPAVDSVICRSCRSGLALRSVQTAHHLAQAGAWAEAIAVLRAAAAVRG